MRDYASVILGEANYGGLPLAYYPLSEVNGAVARDIVGGYDGTLADAPALGQPPQTPFGSGMVFDATAPGVGSAPRVAMGNWPAFTGDFTCMFWGRLRAVAGNPRIAVTLGNAGTYCGIATNAGIRRLYMSTRVNGTQYTMQGPFNVHAWAPDVWTHFAYRRTSGLNEFFANGVQQTPLTAVNQPGTLSTSDAAQKYISHTSLIVNGALSHVSIYNYAVADHRIQHHYLAGINGPAPRGLL